MDAQTVALDILAGQYDADLEVISRALTTRLKANRAVAGAQVAATLAPGDIVRFTSSIRPTYLAGLEATVVSFTRTKVGVKINDPVSAGRYGNGPVNCPPSLLEKVSA